VPSLVVAKAVLERVTDTERVRVTLRVSVLVATRVVGKGEVVRVAG
jgi:hypothetical protein